ncbi:MAG TPA: hypothetical protein VK808_01490 [Bacteroidia bacterium]|jgi:hypothetical protein|nr:hypothetical protein [Bacteroidia bacterium]
METFGHYFFEFFMMFLALYLGFFAENLRERLAEKKQERVYMQNMLEDLSADIVLNTNYTKNNKVVFELIETLVQLIKSPERKLHITKLAYTARMVLPQFKQLFLMERTYEQMKSSGTLRLIGNQEVAIGISYYYHSVSELKKYNDSIMVWAADYGNEMGRIFDAELLLKIIKEKKEIPADATALLTEDPVVLNELITSAQYLYGALILGEKIGNERSIAAKNLIELIKKEYRL